MVHESHLDYALGALGQHDSYLQQRPNLHYLIRSKFHCQLPLLVLGGPFYCHMVRDPGLDGQRSWPQKQPVT